MPKRPPVIVRVPKHSPYFDFSSGAKNFYAPLPVRITGSPLEEKRMPKPKQTGSNDVRIAELKKMAGVDFAMEVARDFVLLPKQEARHGGADAFGAERDDQPRDCRRCRIKNWRKRRGQARRPA